MHQPQHHQHVHQDHHNSGQYHTTTQHHQQQQQQYGHEHPRQNHHAHQQLHQHDAGAAHSNNNNAHTGNNVGVAVAAHHQQHERRFITHEKLGSGTYGDVYKCVERATGKIYVLKKLKATTQKQQLLREISIMQRLSKQHPNIVTLVAVEGSPSSPELVMEKLPLNLLQFLQCFGDIGYVPMPYIKIIVRDILRACAFLHSRTIAHRDLKPENVLIDMVYTSTGEAVFHPDTTTKDVHRMIVKIHHSLFFAHKQLGRLRRKVDHMNKMVVELRSSRAAAELVQRAAVVAVGGGTTTATTTTNVARHEALEGVKQVTEEIDGTTNSAGTTATTTTHVSSKAEAHRPAQLERVGASTDGSGNGHNDEQQQQKQADFCSPVSNLHRGDGMRPADEHANGTTTNGDGSASSNNDSSSSTAPTNNSTTGNNNASNFRRVSSTVPAPTTSVLAGGGSGEGNAQLPAMRHQEEVGNSNNGSTNEKDGGGAVCGTATATPATGAHVHPTGSTLTAYSVASTSQQHNRTASQQPTTANASLHASFAGEQNGHHNNNGGGGGKTTSQQPHPPRRMSNPTAKENLKEFEKLQYALAEQKHLQQQYAQLCHHHTLLATIIAQLQQGINVIALQQAQQQVAAMGGNVAAIDVTKLPPLDTRTRDFHLSQYNTQLAAICRDAGPIEQKLYNVQHTIEGIMSSPSRWAANPSLEQCVAMGEELAYQVEEAERELERQLLHLPVHPIARICDFGMCRMMLPNDITAAATTKFVGPPPSQSMAQQQHAAAAPATAAACLSANVSLQTSMNDNHPSNGDHNNGGADGRGGVRGRGSSAAPSVAPSLSSGGATHASVSPAVSMGGAGGDDDQAANYSVLTNQLDALTIVGNTGALRAKGGSTATAAADAAATTPASSAGVSIVPPLNFNLLPQQPPSTTAPIPPPIDHQPCYITTRRPTPRVMTMSYRAPEVLMDKPLYTHAIDIFSVGCMIPELVTLNILIEYTAVVGHAAAGGGGGNDGGAAGGAVVEYGDGLWPNIINLFKVLGAPKNEAEWTATADAATAPTLADRFPKFKSKLRDVGNGKLLQAMGEEGMDLLTRMLGFVPEQRITAQQALEHPFLQDVARSDYSVMPMPPFAGPSPYAAAAAVQQQQQQHHSHSQQQQYGQHQQQQLQH